MTDSAIFPDNQVNGEKAREPVDRLDLLRLVALVVGALALAVIFHGFPVLIVVLALLIMVMGHEFGHFVTAKLSGMKVTEYFLGFGPRLWSFKRGETEYGIKMIPAGGYVRIVGMSSVEKIAPEDEARSFREATFPKRVLVAVAGSTMHLVMAFVLLMALFMFAGFPTDTSAQVASLTPFVGQQSPAKIAGIRPGDEFVSINGQRFAQPADIVTYIESRPGQLLHVIVLRKGHDVNLVVRPQLRSTIKVSSPQGVERLASPSAKPTGAIGVEIDYVQKDLTTNPLIAVQRSGAMIASMTTETFSSLGTVFSIHGLSSFARSVQTAGRHPKGSSTSAGSSDSGQLLSIYGAVEIGAQAEQSNISLLLVLLVAINLFVGIINLFPMLPLDGGHVVVAVYERIRSRRGVRYFADVNKLTPVVALFVAFILVMGIAALYANIVQPVSLPGR